MDDALPRGLQPLPDHLHAPLLHAGFWRRVAAYIIDSFILGAAAGIVYVAVIAAVFVPMAVQHAPGSPGRMLTVILLMDGVVLLGSWLYFALCEASRWQATPGKLALGLQVTDLYGRRVDFGRATGRFFGKLLSGLILDVGYMLAGWTARKQALHDLMAGCCVVRKEGLAAFERGEVDTGVPASAGMPGWAIALIVVGACFFLIVPLAIMAAIAIPAYQNYIVRAQVAEGVTLAGSAQAAVAAYAGNSGAAPADNAAAGLGDPASLGGKYVSGIAVQNGEVVVTFGGAANRAIAGEHLVFRPYGASDALRWRCSSPDIKVQYLPSTCRE